MNNWCKCVIMNLTEVIAMKTKTNGKEIIHKMDHHLYIWFLALIFVRKIIALKFTFDTFFMIVCVVLTQVSLCDFLVAVYYHSYYYLFFLKNYFYWKIETVSLKSIWTGTTTTVHQKPSNPSKIGDDGSFNGIWHSCGRVFDLRRLISIWLPGHHWWWFI